AADRVHLLRDAGGGSTLGALEEEVLEEVRDAGLLRLLLARSVLDPDAGGDGGEVREALGDDPDPVREARRLHAPTAALPASPLPSTHPCARAGSSPSDRPRGP